MELIKIAIVEDHHLFREGLKLILGNTGKIDVVAEYVNGKEFVNDINSLHCDIILMDISMPEMDGIEASRIALEQRPELKILVLSMFGDEDYYYKMVSTGVKGFLLKEAHRSDLIEGIEAVARGDSYFSQELLRRIIFTYGSSKLSKLKDKNEIKSFSERELDVLRLLCQGMSNVEIAENLYISQRTVEGHRANMLRKTDTKNTISLIMYAIRNGIVEI